MYCRQSRQVFRYPQLARRIKVNWANIIHLHHYSILNNKSTSTSPSQKIPAEMYTELILSTQSGSALILTSQFLIRVYISKCRSGLRYQKGPKKQNQRNISFTKIVSKKTFSVICFNSWKLTFLHDFYSWILCIDTDPHTYYGTIRRFKDEISTECLILLILLSENVTRNLQIQIRKQFFW